MKEVIDYLSKIVALQKMMHFDGLGIGSGV